MHRVDTMRACAQTALLNNRADPLVLSYCRNWFPLLPELHTPQHVFIAWTEALEFGLRGHEHEIYLTATLAARLRMRRI